MIGLAGVFVLGVMMSSHIHVMDPPHGPVAYEKQLHSTTAKAPRLKAAWLEVRTSCWHPGEESSLTCDCLADCLRMGI